jgi:glycosyltransferase involved in cell wall biosynthesis
VIQQGARPSPHRDAGPMRISVVIPLYEQATCVPRAIASVVSQSVPVDEIIVVDDGSTDGGADAAIKAGGQRVTVCSAAHGGEGAARNYGVETASSEWVAFLDADDEWRPDFLEKTGALAKSQPNVVAVFSNMFVPALGRALLRRVPASAHVLDDYFKTLLDNAGAGMSSSSALVRRSALLACGGFPRGVLIGGDLDTWARLAWSGPIGCVPDALATYHTDAPERATVRARERRPDYPAVLTTYGRWLDEGRVPPQLRDSSRRFANHVLAAYAMELAHAGCGQDADRQMREGWRPGGPSHLYLKARLWARLPVRLLRGMRATRQQLRQAWLGRYGAS